MNALTMVLRAVIRGYQLFVSPFLPPSCRYAPTCSHYAMQALAVHGPFRGLWLSALRLLRCHPFGGYGYDPVPPRPNAPDRRRLTPHLR